ncbi:MAG: lycopene beta-cyclase CrtY, partial [Kofleriaceae bacterium]
MDLDYVLVGGGLQAGLIALAVRAAQPHARIAVVERGTTLGGNHTWCFHAGDLPAGAAPSGSATPSASAGARRSTCGWIEPLIEARWPGYDVAFPGLRRGLDSAYACVTSARLDRVVRQAVDELALDTTALAIEADRVETTHGVLRARTVIDARGPAQLATAKSGWQTFVGHEVLAPGHGLARPILMDATVEQVGGFRFFYVLPLAPDRLLIEDTCFTSTPYLDVPACRAAIRSYADAHGWTIEAIVREETGVLALPLAMDVPAPGAPFVAGYGGGYFHPVTGYSFPIAARLAAAVATGSPDALRALHRAHAAQLPFALRLNRMLFQWFAPAQRYHVLERF